LGHAPYWPLYRSLISLGRCGNGVELADPHVGENSDAGSGRKPQKKLAWGQLLAFGAGFDADPTTGNWNEASRGGRRMQSR